MPSATPTPTFPVPGAIRDFELRYRLSDTTSRNHSKFGLYDNRGTHSQWLLINKTIMFEALEQFLRNCEWTRVAYGLIGRERDVSLKYPERRHWTTRLPVDAKNVKSMELYVENLENWGDPRYGMGMDTHEGVGIVASAVRNENLRLDKLRFVGHTYSFHQVIQNGQAGNMFRNLRGMFDDVQIEKFEFGIVDAQEDRYWTLYEWNVARREPSLLLLLNSSPRDLLAKDEPKQIVCKRRVRVKKQYPPPEKDLANLLPPGWVLERKKCGREECDQCYPAETETWRTFQVGS